MPKYIYNEGRVVGYSAYEIYVQQAIANGVKPQEIANEKDWLASSIGMGASLLLKVPAESTSAPDSPHCIAYTLPVDSKLCAANTIVGSFFDGSGYANSGNWMKVVSSYGPLLPNDATKSPSGAAASDVVTADLKRDATQLNQLRSYIQIVDGVVIQPGNWSANNYANGPAKEFTPNLVSDDVATVRILVARRITTAFYLLLTGFTMESVVAGISGSGEGSSAADPSGSVNEPENGDFLGPKLYPWANKIVFSVPPAYINQLLDDTYNRKLPYSASAQSVSDTAIIDMTKTDPKTYYTSNYTDSKVKIYVSKKNPNVSYSVLTVYQRNTALPPALYGTRVTAEGDTYLYPIDTIAPGTVKVYHDDIGEGYQKIKDLEDNTPNNIGVVRSDNSYEWWQQDSEGNQIPVAGVGVQSDNYTGVVGTGKNELHVLSLEDCDGTLHDVDGSDTDTENIELEHSWNDNQYSLTYTGKFSWRTLINMLTKGRKGNIRFTKPPFWYKFITDGSKNSTPVNVLELKNPSKSSNSDDLVYSGEFTWDSLISMLTGGKKGKIQLTQPPFWSKYTTTGNNGNVNITLTGTARDNGGSDYSGTLTWDNLLDMLKGNKKLTIKFGIDPVDPKSSDWLEITNVFKKTTNSRPVEFIFKYMVDEVFIESGNEVVKRRDVSTIYKRLVPYDGSDLSSAISVPAISNTDGVYRVFINRFLTTAGTTSKFDVVIQGYLRTAQAVYAVTDSDMSENAIRIASHVTTSGFVWRGATHNSDAYPLFYDPEGSTISGRGEPSQSILYSSTSEPNYTFLTPTTGRSLVANVIGTQWNCNLTIVGCAVQGGGRVYITDKSSTFDNSATSLQFCPGGAVDPDENGRIVWSAGKLGYIDNSQQLVENVSSVSRKVSGMYITV